MKTTVFGVPTPRILRWSDALLEAVVRPDQFEPIAGDLLEEYREARAAAKAQAWYACQVLNIVWRAVWPYVAALVAVKVIALLLPATWNPRLDTVIGVSLVDALAYVSIGYLASSRTRLMKTGILTAATAGIIAFKLTFAAFAARSPAVLLAPFEKPFIFVILLTLAVIALAFAVVCGAIGAGMAVSLPALHDRMRLHHAPRQNE